MCVSKWITQKNIIVIFNRKALMVEKSNFHFFFLHSANTPFSIPAVKLNSLQRRFTSFKGFCVTVRKNLIEINNLVKSLYYTKKLFPLNSRHEKTPSVYKGSCHNGSPPKTAGVSQYVFRINRW